jgi:hypothetical protein
LRLRDFSGRREGWPWARAARQSNNKAERMAAKIIFEKKKFEGQYKERKLSEYRSEGQFKLPV